MARFLVHCLASAKAPAALLVCVLALAAAGCVESPPEASVDALADARPVRIALHGDPASLDPHLQSEVIAQAVLGNVYDSLVTFDADMRPVPQLAKNWSNPDDLTWRFELRQGITFHDGRPVTAEDVVASLDRVRFHPRSRQTGALVAVAEATASDPYTVEVRTRHPYAVMLSRLAYVFIAPADTPEEVVEPVGSGPYRFVEYLPAGSDGAAVGKLSLEAVDRQWGGRAIPQRVEYYFEADRAARLEGLLSGRYDLVDDLSRSDLGQLQGRDDARVESRSSLLVVHLQADPDQPPFDDHRVRRAIDLAVDRRALVDKLFGIYAEPVGQLVSQNVFGYSPDLEPPQRDLETARRLLAEAGHGDGLRVVLEHRAGRVVAPLLQEQLAEAGIEVELRSSPWSELYERLLTGEVAFYVGGWVCTSADAGDLFDAKVHTPQPESGYGRANYVGYSNPELDALIEEANRTASMEQRGSLWRQGLAILARDLPYIPLYSQHENYGVRSRLDWRPRQDGRVFGRDIGIVESADGMPQPRER